MRGYDGNPRLIGATDQLGWTDPRFLRVAPAKYRACEAPYEPVAGELFSCRKCETCIARRVDDAIGRCLAEAVGSDACFMATMTIGGDMHYGSTADNPKAQALHKPDVILLNKRLRKYIWQDAFGRWKAEDNDPALFVPPIVRLFGTGEYGDKFGRPHYHLLIYLLGTTVLPGVILNQRFLWGRMDESMAGYEFPQAEDGREFWPWGVSHVKEFDRNDAFYLAQYVTKTVQERRGLPAPFKVMAPIRSLRPMLGAGFFNWLACQTVAAQLPCRDDGYQLPKEPWYGGPSTTYFMSRTAKLRYADAYESEWRRRHAVDPVNCPASWPKSEFLDRLAENDANRAQRVWFEGEQFFQRFANVLQHRELEALPGRYASSVHDGYRRTKDGDLSWW